MIEHNRVPRRDAEQTADASRRVTRAVVDLGAIAHNLCLIRAAVGVRVEVMAVVKANAYGHGAEPVARACLAAGATRLAVAVVDEGVALRRAGIDAPILVTGPSAPEEHAAALAHDLTLALGTPAMAAALSATARVADTSARVHVKIDTGLSRFGLPAGDAVEAVVALAARPELRLEGIFTHLASSEEPDKSSARAQLALFDGVLHGLQARGVDAGLRHAANSGAALELPESYYDAVRVGIALYGYPPAGFGAPRHGLRPALALRSRLARVLEVPAGTGVGYNHTYRTARPTVLGLVPLGYADGLPRVLSNRGHMLVGGRRCPIVGNVAMDQTILDVSELPGVAEGDPVVAIGSQGQEWVGADEIGALAGSNSYETLCRISPRVPREFTR